MKKLLLSHINSICVCMIMLAVGCGKRTVQEYDERVMEIERVVRPLYKVPSLDESLFQNRVYIEFSSSGARVSALPSGVTEENNGKMVLLRSSIPGVEYIVGGTTSDASLAIVSEFSPLVTLDSLFLVAYGENALQVSSEEVIFLRSTGNSVISDVADTTKADSQSAVIKLMGRSVLCDGGLVVNAARRSAIFCTDTLYLSDVALSLSGAPNNALLSNKSIVFSDGALSASSAKDVVKCKKGDFMMFGGAVSLSSDMDKADGLQATNVYIADGVLSVVVSGAASDGIKAKGNLCISGGAVSVTVEGGALFNEKKSDYSSASCIKSDAVVDISGGVCALSASGDGSKGISSDSLVIVSGGSLGIVTSGGDVVHPLDINAHASSKGIKSDGNLYFLGGDIEVAVLGEGERSEGVEAKKDAYIGGNARVYVYAYDDALNAMNLTVADGHSYFYSVANDAVDSNGRIDIDGGSLVADGSFSPEQGVDVDDPSAFAMSGGTLLSVGGSMGPYPVLPLDAGTSVPVVAWSGVDAPKNSFVSLASSDGKLLLGYRLPRALERGAVLFASDNLMRDAEYTLALSAGIDSDGYVGNGFYRDGHATDVNDSVAFRLQGLINGVSANGEVTVIEPGKEFPRGMMPPPPPHAVDSAVHGGAFAPPMPPGSFPQGVTPPPFPHAGDTVGGRGAFPPPPPHVRKVKSEYGLGNLPNND